jgi:hypothetical protein
MYLRPEAMRYRYCVEEEQSSLEMNPEPDGLVSGRCGHVEQPSDPNFPSPCRKCVRASQFSHDHRPRTRLTAQHERLG